MRLGSPREHSGAHSHRVARDVFDRSWGSASASSECLNYGPRSGVGRFPNQGAMSARHAHSPTEREGSNRRELRIREQVVQRRLLDGPRQRDGLHVSISVRSNVTSCTQAEATAYGLKEGMFFGNIFAPTRTAYSQARCHRPGLVSFIMALRLIRDEWMWSSGASPGAIPKHLRRLREDIRRFVLPPRRRQRAFPRAVKLKMTSRSRLLHRLRSFSVVVARP